MYYVLISSITYFLAFVWPEYLGWLGLVSLWVLHDDWPRSWGQACMYGVVWGFIFFSAQFCWMLVLLHRYSHASMSKQLCVWLLFIVYMTTFSLGWFVSRFIFQKYVSKEWSFVLSTTLFFMVVYWGSGLPWKIVQNPLCDFAQPIIVFFKLWPSYLYIPEHCIFFGIAAFSVVVQLQSYKKNVLLTLLFLFYFFPEQDDSWQFFKDVYHWKTGTLSQAVVQARGQRKKIIVGCEGKLERSSELEVLPSDMVLLTGAYYFYENGQYDNCAVCVQNQNVQLYQKKFLAPYVEQAQTDFFVQSCCQKQKNDREYFTMYEIVLQPVICSDFYFGRIQFDCVVQKPVIIFFTSDQMLCFHFIKNVLRNFMKKQKYILQVCIVCVSNEKWYVV